MSFRASWAFRRAVLLGVSVAALSAVACSAGKSASQAGSTATGSTSGTGGANPTCKPCVTTTNCGSAVCGQFAGDTYCAEPCDGATCGAGTTCMPVNSAEGVASMLCIPVTACSGTSTNTTASTTSTGGSGVTTTVTGSSNASSSSGFGTCTHSPCTAGAALTSGCDACATAVCAADSYCCSKTWDAQCVTEVTTDCAADACTAGTSSSSSSASSSGTTSSGGSTIGPLATLSFAIVGDTRPANEDDPSGYPTAIIQKIWQDVQAASPRPAFALTTGDYMFASPTHTPGTQATQMGYYVSARAAFTNPVFPVMGNHECDGATADNCYACGSACNNVGGTCVGSLCETPNYQVFAKNLLAPVNQTLPYYVVNVNGTNNAWTSKFVIVACNMWSPTQASWLASALSTTTTYTFVVRHMGTTATTAPCLSGTGSNNADTIISQHPYTLLIAGHTHEYSYYSSEKQVIVGNGGAPLSGSGNYGYVIARQSGSSIDFTSYAYDTNAVVQTFSVP